VVKKEFLIGILLMVVITGIPIAGAENVTPVTTPFITINPIGNHTVGDVFFINGTTNLGTRERSLGLDIEWWAFNPSGFSTPFYATIASIQPEENGTSTWSAEIIPSQWEIYILSDHHPTSTVFKSANPGEYIAYVSSSDPLGSTVLNQQTFFIVPPETPSIPELSNTTTVPESGSRGISAVPTRQNTPCPGYLPVIAVGAVTIWYISDNQRRKNK
jgi:hypothetical protein